MKEKLQSIYNALNTIQVSGKQNCAIVAGVMNVIGNIVVFMPIGMFLPSLFSRCRNIFFTTILTLEISLCVELVQLLTKVGSFDVDDLLLNTIGGVCGYLVYMIYRGIKRLVKC